MALRKIVTVGDPILTKVCRPVTKFDQKLAILIEDMIETMHDANGVGLAGPQVGILRRVVVVDAGDEDIELVNPEVVEVSEETQTGLEGCLSLPGKYGIVTGRSMSSSAHRTATATGTSTRATRSLPAASCTRSTISMAICTPRSPKRCSRPRSLRRWNSRKRTMRRTKADETRLHGHARLCPGLSGNPAHRGL